MYSKKDAITTNKCEISNYIEGRDLYNSKFLYELTSPTIDRDIYEISVYEYRPDLIAKDFYLDEKYAGIVMLQVTGGLESLKRGNKIRLVPKLKVDQIIGSL